MFAEQISMKSNLANLSAHLIHPHILQMGVKGGRESKQLAPSRIARAPSRQRKGLGPRTTPSIRTGYDRQQVAHIPQTSVTTPTALYIIHPSGWRQLCSTSSSHWDPGAWMSLHLNVANAGPEGRGKMNHVLAFKSICLGIHITCTHLS